MRSRWTKLSTAAAAIVLALFVGALVVDQSATSAYAIEQTIEANHSVRTIYLKHFFVSYPDLPLELWAEFDESGGLIRCRMEEPCYEPGQGDGHKIVVWCDNKAELWFKYKGIPIVTRDEMSSSSICRGIKEIDPKLCVEGLQALASEGKVQIEIAEASDGSGPITITATYLPGSPSPDKRLVIQVDPETKLVRQVDTYKRVDAGYEFAGRDEIIEYNKPIDLSLFVLDVPEGVQRIDQYTREVGLEQGDLSEEAVAVEAVRQTLKALIAKDYAKAGRLMGGMSADAVAKRARLVRFVRLLSIGEAERHPKWPILLVPVKVEIERNGTTEVRESKWHVRQLQTQPGRWAVQMF